MYEYNSLVLLLTVVFGLTFAWHLYQASSKWCDNSGSNEDSQPSDEPEAYHTDSFWKRKRINQLLRKNTLQLEYLMAGSEGAAFKVVSRNRTAVLKVRYLKDAKCREAVRNEERYLKKFWNQPGILKLYDAWEIKERRGSSWSTVIQETPQPSEARSRDLLEELVSRLGKPDHVFHIIMTEYCREGDFFEYATKKPYNLTTDSVLESFCEVAKGLDAMHQADIVHRDVKLENIFLGESGAKLGDFGFATRKGTGYFKGTAGLLAPELKDSYDNKRTTGTYSPATDIYALGRSMVDLIEINERVCREVLSPVKDMIKAMLSRNPDDRPSAEDVADALQAARDLSPIGIKTVRNSDVVIYRTDLRADWFRPLTNYELNKLKFLFLAHDHEQRSQRLLRAPDSFRHE